MFLFNFIILTCGFCVYGFNFTRNLPKNSSPSNIMIELLTECNDLRPKFAVIVTGDVDFNMKKLNSNIYPVSLILIRENNNKTRKITLENNPIIFSIKPTLFFIHFNSINNLNEIINHLKTLSWWNIYSLYIILNPNELNNCHGAFNYLWLMWKRDLINAIFICQDINTKIIMFTYNPYTNRAPDIWKIIQHPQTHYPWTLLTYTYTKNSSICTSLDFDKTKFLDGYSGIRAVAFVSDNKTELNEDDDEISKMLFETLNITRNYTVDPNRGHVDGGGLAHGMIKHLINSKYDIILNSRYPAYAKGLRVSSIISQSGLSIVSQPRGYESIIKKILDYFPLWLFISIFILLIVTAGVLKYSLNNFNFGTAITEVIGFFLDGYSLTLPKSIASRIFLFVIFIFVIIIQTLFRGKILSFLTIPIPERNLNTFNDINEMKNYELLCDLGMRKFLDTELKDRCLNISAPKAMENLLTNSQACFVSDKYIIIRQMARYNSYWLHLSRHRVIQEYGIFMIRNNWPLGDRISQGVSRMFESDLSCLVYKRVYGEKIRKIKTIENLHLIRRFRKIRLDDLTFAFEVWAIVSAATTSSSSSTSISHLKFEQ